MTPARRLRRQLVEDIVRLEELRQRWARGDKSAQEKFRRKKGAIDVKLAFLDGAQKAQREDGQYGESERRQ